MRSRRALRDLSPRRATDDGLRRSGGVIGSASGLLMPALTVVFAFGRRNAAVPSAVGIGGCRACSSAGRGERPAPCPGTVVWTGLVLVRPTKDRPAQAWQAFACGEHTAGLVARRRLQSRDRAVLVKWREHAQRSVPGGPDSQAVPDDDVSPRPLAEGDLAYELIQRVRHWAALHLDD